MLDMNGTICFIWVSANCINIPLSLNMGAVGNVHEWILRGKRVKFFKGSKNWKHQTKKPTNVPYKVVKTKVTLIYLKFSELNSDSRNLRNCSLPTGSFKASSMPNPHRFTLCCPGSLLQNWKSTEHTMSILILCICNLDQVVKFSHRLFASRLLSTFQIAHICAMCRDEQPGC